MSEEVETTSPHSPLRTDPAVIADGTGCARASSNTHLGPSSEDEKVSLVQYRALHNFHPSTKTPPAGATPAMQAFVRALAREAARIASRSSAEPSLSKDTQQK
jgi:hypothetical protein